MGTLTHQWALEAMGAHRSSREWPQWQNETETQERDTQKNTLIFY